MLRWKTQRSLGGDGLQDRLKIIWQKQSEQQERLGLNPKDMSIAEKMAHAKDLGLIATEELSELMRASLRYKAHMLKAEPVDTSHVVEEMVDLFKSVIALAQLYGVGDQRFFNSFIQKTSVVDHRADGEQFELREDTNLILVDLDGCLADLSSFDKEINDMHMKYYSTHTLSEILAMQEAAKTEFRKSGGYKDLPAIFGAQSAMEELKRDGYKIVILTARPHRQYKRLYGDTLEWLGSNHIQHDLLLFERDKAEAIVKYIHPATPLLFVEDRMKHALEVSELSIDVALFGASARTSPHTNPFIRNCDGWREVLFMVRELKRIRIQKKYEYNVQLKQS